MHPCNPCTFVCAKIIMVVSYTFGSPYPSLTTNGENTYVHNWPRAIWGFHLIDLPYHIPISLGIICNETLDAYIWHFILLRDIVHGFPFLDFMSQNEHDNTCYYIHGQTFNHLMWSSNIHEFSMSPPTFICFTISTPLPVKFIGILKMYTLSMDCPSNMLPNNLWNTIMLSIVPIPIRTMHFKLNIKLRLLGRLEQLVDDCVHYLKVQEDSPPWIIYSLPLE